MNNTKSTDSGAIYILKGYAAANIDQIPNLEKLIATLRSREISACLVLQAKSQLKAIYKDNADTIIGNCDSQIFLGGSEQSTLKDLNSILGKECKCQPEFYMLPYSDPAYRAVSE